MKKTNLIVLMLIMVCTAVGCSNKNTNSDVSSVNKEVSNDNQEDINKEASTVTLEPKTEDVIEVTQTPEQIDMNETEVKGTEEPVEETSTYDVFSDVYETSHFSIGDMEITFPITWDDLKVILDENDVDYTDLATNIERSKIQANNTVFLDDEDNHGNGFIIYLQKDGENITVESINVNMAKGLHIDKYPVKFDGLLDINNDIDDAIKIYGEPDLVVDKMPQMVYRWEISDKRKVQITITTGLGVDPEKISIITVRTGEK